MSPLERFYQLLNGPDLSLDEVAEFIVLLDVVDPAGNGSGLVLAERKRAAHQRLLLLDLSSDGETGEACGGSGARSG